MTTNSSSSNIVAASPEAVRVTSSQKIDIARVATRREHDLLGELDVPADAYWGIHTLRAVTNFPITGVPIGHFPELVRALALVKQAAARANRRLGLSRPGKVRRDRTRLRCSSPRRTVSTISS